MRLYFLVIILFSCFLNSQAQLPYTFTEIARNTHYGSASGVVVSPDGTIFLANGEAGLMAFSYDGSSFKNTAHIDIGGNFHDVTIGPDGTVFAIADGLYAFNYDGVSFKKTAYSNIGNSAEIAVDSHGIIFVAKGSHGLYAYSYDGRSFTFTARDDNRSSNVAVGPDGTVFSSAYTEGLKAFSYDGATFTNTAYIDNGGNSWDVEVDESGNVFLVTSSGFRVYSYDGASFTNIVQVSNDTAYAKSVAVGNDGSIFLNCGEGLRAYNFNDTSFTNTAITGNATYDEESDLTVGPDGTIFWANAYDGLRAFIYDGSSFKNTAHHNSGQAVDLAVRSDGAVFLANSGISGMFGHVFATYGMQVYKFDGFSFNNMTYSNDGYLSSSVTLDSNGTVFLANTGMADRLKGIIYQDDGLRSYKFTNDSLINTAHIDDEGLVKNVAVSSNGIVFQVSTEGLHAYNYNDTSFIRTAQINDNWMETVAIYSDTIILVGGYDDDSDKLWAYNYNGTAFTNIAYINSGNSVSDITIGPDRTIFIASEQSGLGAYNFDGNSLKKIATINNGGIAKGVAVSLEGTIFLANRKDGLRAYTFNGNSFINVAHINTGGNAEKVKVGPDGIVYLANGSEGLIAYEYSGFTTSLKEQPLKLPKNYILSQNYPNPFNPETIINYELRITSDVKLIVYDVTGREVETLVNQRQAAGKYSVTFDATNLASGVYYYKLIAGEYTETRKMVLLK